MHDPLGLSIGTTNLVVARAGKAPVTRRSVLIRFPDRAPEVGLAADNSNLAEPGVVIAGFVECVGDRVPLVAEDGSTHDPELLLVEAIDAMVTTAGATPGSAEVTIAVPAHWEPAARSALGEALRTSAGQSRLGPPPRVVPDAVAALTALNADPGLPADGVVALLDFGGSGTSITLADARSDFEPIDETVRYPEFSGDQIDQELLVVVLNEIGRDVDASATTAAEPLGQLREQCRQAKERLSVQTVTELVTELRGYRSSVQLTRAELEDLIHDPLSGVLSALEDLLKRNKIRWADLAAVATAGGGASIPLISERLSFYRGVPVVTTRQPAVSVAVGAALLTAREPVTATSTAVSPAVTTTAGIGTLPTDDATATRMASQSTDDATATRMAGLPTDDATATRMTGLPTDDAGIDEPDSPTSDGELAWSQEDGGDDPVPYSGPSFSEGDSDSRRQVSYVPARLPSEPPPPGRLTRLPRLILGLAALLAMIAIGGVAYTLSNATQEDEKTPPAPRPSVIIPTPTSIQPPPPSLAPPPPSVAPPPPSAAPPPPPPPSPAPPPPPVTTQPPPRTTTRPPTTTTTTTTTTPPPTTTTTPPTTTTTVPMTTEYLTIPFVPVPIPIQVPQKEAPAQPQNPYQP